MYRVARKQKPQPNFVVMQNDLWARIFVRTLRKKNVEPNKEDRRIDGFILIIATNASVIFTTDLTNEASSKVSGNHDNKTIGTFFTVANPGCANINRKLVFVSPM